MSCVRNSKIEVQMKLKKSKIHPKILNFDKLFCFYQVPNQNLGPQNVKINILKPLKHVFSVSLNRSVLSSLQKKSWKKN